MPVSYTHDDSPSSSTVSTAHTHLRKRSSMSASHPSNAPSPFLPQTGQYNEKTGEIHLPTSPPLHAWQEKHESALGLYYDDSKKGRLPPYSWPSGRTKRITKPWLSVAVLAGATLLLVVILYWINPTSSYNTAILSRIPFKAAKCEPYSAFGSLSVDTAHAENNKWVPFDSSCTTPQYLADLRSEHPTSDFSWLRNRTALIIGDSVSREHVENFCQLMGRETEVIRKHHKYSPSPSPVRGPAKAGHPIDKPARLGARGFRVVRDASLPRMCYIPEYDFMLVSVFHFGLDQEDYWRGSRMPQYAAPGMFEHRLSDVIQPLIANLRADGRASAPDYVEVTSGTWDLARWAEQDMDEQKDTETGLTQDRVTWFRFRVGQMLERVRTAFPQAKAKTWRTMHYPLDQVAEHEYFMDKITSRPTNASIDNQTPPSFAHNRIYQLDQAVRSLIQPTVTESGSVPGPHADFRMNEWGTIMKGHDAHQKDRLHGDPLPGGYVWSDVMLYELHHGVVTADAQPLRSVPRP
ncbi:hypothetical protein MNV49_000278 [Pseudohyphozyma bogoriensis]|nr:hypothetical protein MNV49_000278 [Pseudohyphozyma bogoriensis]